jgi:DMSO/TMAO reductase YedYZ molybdopterin-dependent catalytic subunit
VAGGFAEWRLTVDGEELKRFPARRQITACEQGWSFIAEWIGGMF